MLNKNLGPFRALIIIIYISTDFKITCAPPQFMTGTLANSRIFECPKATSSILKLTTTLIPLIFKLVPKHIFCERYCLRRILETLVYPHCYCRKTSQ